MHNIHFLMGLVALLVFIVQGVLLLKDKPSKAMTSLAAIISMILFGTGLALVFTSHTMSFANSWVMSKLIGTLLFVSFSVIAFKADVKRPTAILLWLLALVVWVSTFALAKGLLDPIG